MAVVKVKFKKKSNPPKIQLKNGILYGHEKINSKYFEIEI